VLSDVVEPIDESPTPIREPELRLLPPPPPPPPSQTSALAAHVAAQEEASKVVAYPDGGERAVRLAQSEAVVVTRDTALQMRAALREQQARIEMLQESVHEAERELLNIDALAPDAGKTIALTRQRVSSRLDQLRLELVEAVRVDARLTAVSREALMSAFGGSQYFVKTLTGRTISLSLGRDALVWDAMFQIRQKERIPIEQQRLIFAGRQLQPSDTIAHVGAERESTFHLVLRLRGC